MKIKALMLTALTVFAVVHTTPKAHADNDAAAIVAGALALGLGIAAASHRRDRYYDYGYYRPRHYRRHHHHHHYYYGRHHHSWYRYDDYPRHWDYPVNPPYTIYRR